MGLRTAPAPHRMSPSSCSANSSPFLTWVTNFQSIALAAAVTGCLHGILSSAAAKAADNWQKIQSGACALVLLLHAYAAGLQCLWGKETSW